MKKYFLVSEEELDTIVSRHMSTKIEMAIRSRPSPAPTEPDFCKCLKIALKEEFLLSDFCRVCDGRKTCGIDGFKEQLLKHDAALVATTLDKLTEWVEAMRDVADTRAPDDEDIDEIYSQGEKVAYTIVLEKISSLRLTSAPEQEDRK